MGEAALPAVWRIVRHGPAPAAWNMAVDEALARECAEDEGVLRLYRWARPSLSFGRNQAARTRYDPGAFGPLGVEAVRRPTGGREVLHDREVTYALVLPLREVGAMRPLYRLVNEALVSALRSLGAPVGLAAPDRRTPPPDAGACFHAPAADEIESGGRKLVGSAQARIGRTLLQHGSILLGAPSVSLSALLAPPGEGEGPLRRRPDPGAGEPDRPQPGTTLTEVLGGPVGAPRVAAAVEAALAGTLGGRWTRDELREPERLAIRALEPRYRSRDWSWRR